MKKMMFLTLSLFMAVSASAQKDLVNSFFEKYTGVEGITSVNISGDMLNMMAQAEAENIDSLFSSKFSQFRILAVKKACDKPVAIDLKAELLDKLDKSVYKEMMTVKEAGQDVVILFQESNGRIAEMLLVVSGSDENVLIQVKGDMVLSEMAQMAGKFKMQGFEHLKNVQ